MYCIPKSPKWFQNWYKLRHKNRIELTTNIEKSEMCKYFSKYIFWNYYLIISLYILKYQYGLSVDIFNVIFLLANNHRHWIPSKKLSSIKKSKNSLHSATS